MGLLSMMLIFNSEMKEIERMNQRKIDECYDRFFNVAPTLPRKQKKKMRKQANKDYAFWKGLSKWHKETLGF